MIVSSAAAIAIQQFAESPKLIERGASDYCASQMLHSD